MGHRNAPKAETNEPLPRSVRASSREIVSSIPAPGRIELGYIDPDDLIVAAPLPDELDDLRGHAGFETRLDCP